MKTAKQNKEEGSQTYTILLILTDGEIHDMENTINCIIQSAALPLSIIIVGIGNADFTKMETLDGDEGLYNSNGVKAERDLVQFVPFRKFSGNPEALAREVLYEVPDQLVEYMQIVGVQPKPPRQIDVNTIYNKAGTMAEGAMNSENTEVSRHHQTQLAGYQRQDTGSPQTQDRRAALDNTAQLGQNFANMGINVAAEDLNMRGQENGNQFSYTSQRQNSYHNTNVSLNSFGQNAP